MPFLNTNGITLHYRVVGDGPWLTIVGGLGDNARNWAAIAAQLGRRFKTLLIDNRGAGQSDRPPGPYHIEDMAADVTGVLESLGIGRTHLLGFSMGGKIALHIAIHRPDLLDKLILVAATAAYEKGASHIRDAARNLLNHFDNTASHFEAQFDLLFSDAYKKKFRTGSFAKFKLEDPNPQTREDFLAQYAAVRDFDASRDAHLVIAPTLVLSGTKDRMTPHENSEWLAEHIPHARLVLYPGVGHVPQAEQTKRFLVDVEGFLTEA
jgi:pimeloyl-ACP methyl ester carboxylesterase